MDGTPKDRLRLLPGPLQYQCKHPRLGGVSKTGKLSQGPLRCLGQAAEPRCHEIDHVVGKASVANALNVPDPACRIAVELKQGSVGQRGDELDQEEGIAAGFLEHEAS